MYTVKLRTSKLRNRRLLNVGRNEQSNPYKAYERDETDIA